MRIIKESVEKHASSKKRITENYNDDPKKFDKVFEEFENLYDIVKSIKDTMGNAKDEEITNKYFKSFIADIDAKIYDIEELLK